MRMEKVFFQFKLTARVPTLPTNHWNKVYKHLLFSIAPISGFCLFGWQNPCVLQFGHSTKVKGLEWRVDRFSGGGSYVELVMNSDSDANRFGIHCSSQLES